MADIPQTQCSSHMRPLLRRAFRNIGVVVVAMLVLRLTVYGCSGSSKRVRMPTMVVTSFATLADYARLRARGVATITVSMNGKRIARKTLRNATILSPFRNGGGPSLSPSQGRVLREGGRACRAVHLAQTRDKRPPKRKLSRTGEMLGGQACTTKEGTVHALKSEKKGVNTVANSAAIAQFS